jgi:hypothetical protein
MAVRRPPYRVALTAVVFLHGAAIATMALLFGYAAYEDRLFDQLVDLRQVEDLSETEQAVSLMGLTNELMWPRKAYFEGRPYLGVRDDLFRGGDTDLVDGKGSCGAFSGVLGRLLTRAGLPIRLVQMECVLGPVCHIIVEAKADGRWIVLDPLFNLAFRKPDGTYASVADVSRDWDDFRDQIPDNYDPMYRYAGWRYTNWDKIPYIMPAVKWLLDQALGQAADRISIRAHVLNRYRVYGLIVLSAYAFLCLATFVLFHQGRASRRTANPAQRDGAARQRESRAAGR